MSDTILTILVPMVPKRLEQAGKLIANLEEQIGDRPVEVLGFLDNKKRSIGAKRNGLKSLVNGRYFMFCDDDDDALEGYIDGILRGAKFNPDVITFRQKVTLSGVDYQLRFHIDNEDNEECLDPEDVVNRPPWHVCAWKTELFQQYDFSDKMYGEDWDFAKQCIPHVNSHYHVNEVLHHYTFDKETTEAIYPEKEEVDESSD